MGAVEVRRPGSLANCQRGEDHRASSSSSSSSHRSAIAVQVVVRIAHRVRAVSACGALRSGTALLEAIDNASPPAQPCRQPAHDPRPPSRNTSPRHLIPMRREPRRSSVSSLHARRRRPTPSPTVAAPALRSTHGDISRARTGLVGACDA